MGLEDQGTGDTMAKISNLMAKLRKMDGAVLDMHDPHQTVIRTGSPSVNFIYGNGWGVPYGFTEVLFGEPKGGKTVLLHSKIGQMHRDDPDAVAVKFDTEFRERGQMTPSQMALWGIDPERYTAFSVNSPDQVFDRIEKDIPALIDDGLPVRLIGIDSITGIQGRRALNAESVMTQQIGDLAQTLQDGFKRILPIQRRYNFAVILTAHVRAEMDVAEQQRGNKVKMAASFGVKHYAEYFTFVEPLRTKAGRTDELGASFEDTTVQGLNEKGERTGHKIRVTMKDSSLGPKGRTGVFTLDYKKGIVNTHEEVFKLGVGYNVIDRPSNAYYAFGDKKWNGKPAILDALKNDPSLCKAILQDLKRRDLEGSFGGEPTDTVTKLMSEEEEG